MRRPSVGRLIAGTFAATIILLTCIDTTMACRFLFKNRGCNPCAQVSVCAAPAPVRCEPAPPVCCSMPYDQPIMSAPIVSDSVVSGCCGSETVSEWSSPVVDSSYSYELAPAPTYSETPLYSEGSYSEGTIIEGGVVEGGVVSDSSSSEASEVPEPSDDAFDAAPEPELAELEDDTAADDTGFDMPTDDDADDALDGFGDDAPVADDMPADDFGDMPLDDAPAADAPLDDTDFGDDAGFGDEPDFGDDAGFGDDTGFDEPAAADDLPAFDEAPADDVPADIPADEGDDSLDDLFGGNDAAGSGEPRVARQNDDLNLDGDAAGDLFSEPAAETPADVPADNVDDLDDLFGFRELPQTRPVSQPAPIASRVWTDNTGQYKTVGRLVKISSTHIRLLKDTGRFTTVSKQRLSPADLDYVQQKTAQLGVEDFNKIARR